VMKDAFILFLKYPERSKIKTRLAAALGDEAAYDLYLCFLRDIAAMTKQVKAEIIIAYSGPDHVTFDDFPVVYSLQQRGNDIGERMFFAMQDVFAQDYERIVLIGSDIPDLPADYVNDAFTKLALADVVLGPSADGGYYLIGCKPDSLRRSFFHNMLWSINKVFPETLRRIEEAGLKTSIINEWPDIDEIDDLKRFFEANKERGDSHVMDYLKTSGILLGL
jgi:uncharacterized protein